VKRIMSEVKTDDREFLWLLQNPKDVFEVFDLGEPRQT
jgi:hypothetical protein